MMHYLWRVPLFLFDFDFTLILLLQQPMAGTLNGRDDGVHMTPRMAYSLVQVLTITFCVC
jgi:hypothetical protein